MARFTPAKPSLLTLSPPELEGVMEELGQKRFRARQLGEWLYKQRAAEFAEMANLPKALREQLEERYCVVPLNRLLVKQSGDVTEKLLLQLEDGALIETVLIRYPQEGVGQEGARKTVCISTQVGCAYGCKFCASGLEGWRRDLTAAEIFGQFVEICRLEGQRGGTQAGASVPFDNVVVMGMGEPLANYDNLLAAIRALNADWGFHFGARRITVSTSGLVPQIRRLAEEPIQFRLAISLHGATNPTRDRIMPVNKRYPLEELIPAAKYFSERHGRMLTLEYILIEEVNDLLSEAEELVPIARDLHAHVNLIPYNRVDGLDWRRPNIKRQIAFANVLRMAGVSVTVRKEKGHEIDGACGQLRLKTEKSLAAGA